MVPVRLSADHHPGIPRHRPPGEGAPAVAETAEMVESDEAEPVVEAEEDFESEEAGLAARPSLIAASAADR